MKKLTVAWYLSVVLTSAVWGVAVFVCFSALTHKKQALPPASVEVKPTPAQIALRSACRLIRPEGEGSGVVVSLRGKPYILTAAHVVEGVTSLKAVSKWEGEHVSRTVAVRDNLVNVADDLALVIPEFHACLTPATLAIEPHTPPGVECWYCGSGHRLPFHLVRSIVNQHTDGYLWVNGEGYYGHSGSGVYVGGELVGILCGGKHDGPKAPAYCADWYKVTRFLNRCRFVLGG